MFTHGRDSTEAPHRIGNSVPPSVDRASGHHVEMRSSWLSEWTFTIAASLGDVLVGHRFTRQYPKIVRMLGAVATAIPQFAEYQAGTGRVIPDIELVVE